MKKIITVLLSGVIISFAITGNAAAQSFDKGVAFAAIKNNPALAAYVAGNSSMDKNAAASTKESLKSAEMDLKTSKSNLKALKANFRASESFKKAFKDTPDATWNANENAIVASFSKDEVKTNVVYDKQGFWIHTLNYFPADKTPADIRAIVESDYPNGDITLAVKVKEGDMEFYIVQLEDKRTIKQVSVYEGATNLIKEYDKSR